LKFSLVEICLDRDHYREGDLRMKNSIKTSLMAMVALTLLASGKAQAAPPASLKMAVGIGLGYQLCPERKGSSLPDLQDAFLCSQKSATPQYIELELKNKPAAKPEWLYYEAPYNETVEFRDIKVTLEALVMYAKYDGKTSGFIDGRLYSEQNGKRSEPVYFRASAEGGLDKLTYSSAYGTTTPFKLSNGTTAQFSPFVAFDRAR
jgi:hypothetical protein